VVDARDLHIVACRSEVHPTEIPGRIDIDAPAHVAVLEHRAVGEGVIRLCRVHHRDLAKPLCSVLELCGHLVGRGFFHGLDQLQQPVGHDPLLRDGLPARQVDHRVAQRVLGCGIDQTAAHGHAVGRHTDNKPIPGADLRPDALIVECPPGQLRDACDDHHQRLGIRR